MQYVAFYVGKRPRAMWDTDLTDKNLAFLRGLDSAYYSYVAEANEPMLTGDSKLQAAIALRIAYSQGVETLMALVCASIQAPNCILGWMLEYRTQELSQVVQRITSGVGTLPVHPYYSPPSWELFAQRVFENATCDDDRRLGIATNFGGSGLASPPTSSMSNGSRNTTR